MSRRVWKWVLGLFGGMALLLALLVFQAHRGASAAFEDFEQRVAGLKAEIRERASRRPALLGPARPGEAGTLYRAAFTALSSIDRNEETLIQRLGNLFDDPLAQEPDLAEAGRFYENYASPIEQLRRAVDTRGPGLGGLVDLDEAESFRSQESVFEVARFLEGAAALCHQTGRDRQALEILVILLGLAQDLQGWGADALSSLRRTQEVTYPRFRVILSDHRLSAGDLEAFCGQLDRLEARGPTQGDADLAAEIREYEFVFEAERRDVDPENGGFFTRSWRNLFSWRLARAAALKEISSYFRRKREFAALGIRERIAAATNLGESWRERKRWEERINKDPTQVLAREEAQEVYEANIARGWVLSRVMAAVAWYEEDRGKEPDRLSDLVPRYLPRIPINPVDGEAVGYSEGTVIVQGPFGSRFTWKPKRR